VVLRRIEDLDAPRVVPGSNGRHSPPTLGIGMDWGGPSSSIDAARSGFRARRRHCCAWTRDPCFARARLRLSKARRKRGTSKPQYREPDAALLSYSRRRSTRVRKPCGVGHREAWYRKSGDGFAGPYEKESPATVGDFLIARKSGAPAYQLA